MPWRPVPLSYAIAIYPFQPSTSSSELPLQIGDQLYVIEQGGKDDAWCRGYLVQQPSLLSALTAGHRGASDARVFSGIFPRCCIEIRERLGHEDEHKTQPFAHGATKPQAPVPMLKIGDESATSVTEPLVDEIASCLREWHVSYLPDIVLQQDYQRLEDITTIVTQLDYARRQLLNDVLTAEERITVRRDAVWNLVRGNKLIGAEVIVRDPEQKGRLLTAEGSAVDMAKLQSIMSVLNNPPVAKQEVTRLYHCLLEVKASNAMDEDGVTVVLALYQKTVDGNMLQLSENFTCSTSQTSKILFSDLAARDIASTGRLFLVARASISEIPRTPAVATLERPPSRTGTFSRTRESLANRRKSNMVFGSRREKENPRSQHGRSPSARPDQSPDSNSSEHSASKPKPVGLPVPRTVGWAAYDAASLIKSREDAKIKLDMWMPAASDYDEDAEVGWPGVLPELLGVRSPHFVRCKNLSSIQLEVKSYLAADADTLIRTNPTSMHMISKAQRIGFPEAPTKRRSDIYMTLQRVRITPNSAYSHPQFGALPVKSGPLLNLQTTMEIRDSAGKRIERCIYAAANGPAVTALRTQAVEVDGIWDQTICLRLPMEKVAEAHVVLSVADAPGFPFALAWMPLWDKHAFRRDGEHSLILHAYDKTTSTFSDSGKGIYLDLPWDHSTLKDKSVTIASLEIRTQVVSTEFSQDRTLTSLFNWRALSSASLMDTLQRMVFVQEIEIVKQLNEVLDSLFAILEYKAGTHKFEDLIFNDIVFVLGIVHDRRYNLGPLVERYADEHFRAPPVAPSMVRSFTRLMQSVSDPQSARDLRALFKVGKQFLRLLLTTYLQHEDAQTNLDPPSEYEGFRGNLKAVFFGLQMMMRSETPVLVGSKTLLTQNFHTWLPELLKIYSKVEVIGIATDMIDACDEATGKLSLYRLILILDITAIEQLWEEDKDWDALVESCLKWLELHWPEKNDLTDDWRDQIRLCSSIVASLLRRPVPALFDFLPAIFQTYSALMERPSNRPWTLSLLFQSTYPFATKPTESSDVFDEALLELAGVVSDIIRIQPVPVRKWNLERRAQHISHALGFVHTLLSDSVKPQTWLSLHVSHHSAALNVLVYVATEMQQYFVPEPEEADLFNTELWKVFFDTLLALVSSPALTLETFSEQKRRAVWKIAGDVRQAGADLLRGVWNLLGWEASEDDRRRYHLERLGGYQVQYVPSLVGPVIELCLSMHEGLRRIGVEILQTMIISEWSLNEDLNLIETEIIGALNAILKKDDSEASVANGNEIVARKLFVVELLEAFNTIANQPEDALWTTLEDLVATIEELIDLLSGGAQDEDEDQAHDLGRSSGARTSTHPDIPERSISRLEGKVYGDQALQMYKQLADEYEQKGDYARLAKTHRAMARIHETRAVSRSGHRENGDMHGLDEEDE